MPLLLLYHVTLGNECSQFNISLLIATLPSRIQYHGFFEHWDKPPKNSNYTLARITLPWFIDYCHYCNVDFVLFYKITCYTNSLSSWIQASTTELLTITCTFICHKAGMTEFRVYFEMFIKICKIYHVCVHEFIQRAPLRNPIIACDASTYLSTREVSPCWLFILWQYAGKERRRRHNFCAVGVSVQPFASWIWSVRAFHCEWHQPLRAGTWKAGRRHQLESPQI